MAHDANVMPCWEIEIDGSPKSIGKTKGATILNIQTSRFCESKSQDSLSVAESSETCSIFAFGQLLTYPRMGMQDFSSEDMPGLSSGSTFKSISGQFSGPFSGPFRVMFPGPEPSLMKVPETLRFPLFSSHGPIPKTPPHPDNNNKDEQGHMARCARHLP